jgi:outer membrane protein OmpA-like peptidoglycan-associated protein
MVVGHTDTTGSRERNFELGMKRANTVRLLLIEIGLDSSAIQLASHGEAEPLVATADDVFEPRNRRVEITIR